MSHPSFFVALAGSFAPGIKSVNIWRLLLGTQAILLFGTKVKLEGARKMTVNAGRFLRVNLSSGKITTETVPEQVAVDFVGARGYGIKYLYQELAPHTDPFGEDNKLILTSGPLAGTS